MNNPYKFSLRFLELTIFILSICIYTRNIKAEEDVINISETKAPKQIVEDKVDGQTQGPLIIDFNQNNPLPTKFIEKEFKGISLKESKQDPSKFPKVSNREFKKSALPIKEKSIDKEQLKEFKKREKNKSIKRSKQFNKLQQDLKIKSE